MIDNRNADSTLARKRAARDHIEAGKKRFKGRGFQTGGPASELAGGYAGVFGPITGLGGVLGTLGFLLFAATLWPTLGRLPTGSPL